MAVIFIEPGGAATGAAAGTMTDTPQTGSLYNGPKSGTTSIDTTLKEHGYSSIKCDATATPASAYVARLACLAAAGRRISFRCRWTTGFGPSAAGRTGFLRVLSGTTEVFSLTVTGSGSTPAGRLGVYNSTTALMTLPVGATFALDTWYRVALSFTITSTTVYEIRVWVDGTLIHTISGGTAIGAATADNLRIGMTGTSPIANSIFNFQDVYVDDSNALTDPGDIRVTAKKPSAAGDTNAFDTAVGTGTNRWDRVSERPTSTANGYLHAGTGVARENYTVEAASVGSDDLTNATILDWAAWAYWTVVAAAGNASSALVRNGTDVTQTSVAATGVYQMAYSLANLTTYPSANNVVGYKSTATTVDTTLAECGVIIAYVAGVATFSLPPNLRNRYPHVRM